MKRKVIQIAESTQLISLPRKWALKYGVKKGDELDVEAESDHLIIRTGNVPDLKEVEITVSQLDRSSIFHVLRNLYRRGYNVIKVSFDKPITPHYRLKEPKKIISVLHEEVHRLPGLEIIQQKENFCLIKNVSEVNEKEFDNILRRVFILLTDMSSDLLTGMKNVDLVMMETIEEKHFSVTKFINLCLRMLNQRSSLESSKLPFLYHLISTIWFISSSIKYCARDFLNYKKALSPETYKLLELIDYQIKQFYEFFYKFDFERIRKLSENKEKIKIVVDQLPEKNIPAKELILLDKMVNCLEMMVDMIGARVALQF
ncbi:MAG TPA: AbrB/MazE/SpoVT family DNA-binding domain-containing protein [Candidatus Nanoarchaeia archaeon]|nr:AbrB/MazE/SpoVT family DNA-binding domain-containing protein [Candidatus Nanoarchaeia archaeon]